MTNPALWAAALGFGFGPAPAADAQPPNPVGGEFEINSYTTGRQDLVSAAAGPDGSFVVVWRSNGSAGTDRGSYSIQGRRYASNGSPQGAQIQINTYTTSFQLVPAVSADANGGFVVVWYSNGSSGTDTSQSSIQGQRYASNGSKQGAQFQVNTFTTGYQRDPSVAADAGGGFVVVWDSDASSGTDPSGGSVQGQRYASDGSLQGAQFQVNTYTTSAQVSSAVAAGANGDIVVVWESDGSFDTDTSARSVQGQRFASNGSPQGAQFQVNVYTTSMQLNPSVAANAEANFVVVWESDGSPGTDTFYRSIQGQRYASDGSTQGAQFQVNTYTTNVQEVPTVGMDADGDFVAVWASNGSPGTDAPVGLFFYSVQGQRYASDGSAQGAQFQVNTYTTSQQFRPSVAAAPGGDFAVVWYSEGSFGIDTSNASIQGQRYNLASPAPPVPAMSFATRLTLAGALLLLGAAVARAYGSVSRRSRFSR